MKRQNSKEKQRKMFEQYGCLAVIGLYVCSVLCEDLGADVGCNVTLQDVTVLEDHRLLNISLAGEKVWCYENGSCMRKSDQQQSSNTNIYQRSPVFTIAGTFIRFTIPEGLDANLFTVYQTNRNDFIACDLENATAYRNISEEGEEITGDQLQEGANYFVFGATNDSISNCTEGDRIIVFVKRNDCYNSGVTAPCSNHGACTTTAERDAFSCSCCDGYEGRFCQQYKKDVDTTCLNVTCLNGGTCIDHLVDERNTTGTTNSTRCECKPYFTGTFCETRMDRCMSNPCQRGVCVEKPPSYQCYCVPGFHGKQCEKEYNECISNPCLHGGTCVDRLDKYTCICTHGHTGVNCESKVDLCKPNPCHFNSTCVNTGDDFLCTCPQGLTGHTCESQVNECASNPCQNQGTCVDLKNGFECICPITFAGVHCEYMMDVFAPPIEGSEMNGNSHSHNLYVVAGTLSGAILLVLIVLVACYCKMHETYRQLTWRRMRYKRRSLSCPDLESYGGASTTNKHRLSVDAIWEATSLCYDNASFEHSQRQTLASQRI